MLLRSQVEMRTLLELDLRPPYYMVTKNLSCVLRDCGRLNLMMVDLCLVEISRQQSIQSVVWMLLAAAKFSSENQE